VVELAWANKDVVGPNFLFAEEGSKSIADELASTSLYFKVYHEDEGRQVPQFTKIWYYFCTSLGLDATRFFLSSASSGRQNNSLYFSRRALDLLRLVHLPDQEEAYSYCDGLTFPKYSILLPSFYL
jgi:hypothetical protein